LRFPNNHTHFFSFIILYLFAEATLVCSWFSLYSGISFFFYDMRSPH
jgi:hypothetical protein